MPKSKRRRFERQRKSLSSWDPRLRQLLDWSVIIGSVLICLMLLPSRLPGMQLLGIAPNWLLIWVVAWSVKRPALQGAFAGIILGLLQDGMTSPEPTHALSLGIVGLLTGLFQKQRFIQEDFISIALIVFGMSVLSETIFASQMIWMSNRHLESIWTYYQKVVLASAILSSLWAPVVYFPLNNWWQKVKLAEQP
ncbi:rod shape-determining protein MreD [Mastigocoleus testarum]|uniref:Rod shape-determining protein MreD n=1 Tax=Mastigocoleus testarum BC008 TaxID=371196 RepID=A0A0V7ZK49_9CYAN|nr:rod shape-determining protein MreD [Mastigocoleus testarum]KST64891.1 rod shape-determining protein MreD [Mastigocoleus testarum BC008]KST67028.1 rod shape-determining protein MreD [Mastigocoleus testarum BC008]